MTDYKSSYRPNKITKTVGAKEFVRLVINHPNSIKSSKLITSKLGAKSISPKFIVRFK